MNASITQMEHVRDFDDRVRKIFIPFGYKRYFQIIHAYAGVVTIRKACHHKAIMETAVVMEKTYFKALPKYEQTSQKEASLNLFACLKIYDRNGHIDRNNRSKSFLKTVKFDASKPNTK
ncbi:hypothetical protein LT722_20410 [Pseudomonas syringae pv. syringae]|uniref:hypothetical protein n=1 Tax=Pseudomonas syringae TaxID=317 RepID=UPI00200A0A73|nr:hypothetical protein [Pseudomonas syringae]MCK9715010.1 hypothetical protein [Pseudomonas syringae pv. syringae]MCK9763999.1 hypothetical protein [Pseudomonas syringae pv. syringae]